MIEQNMIWLILLGGGTLFLLLVAQILGGLGKIRLAKKHHQKIAFIILFVAILHGSAALYFLLNLDKLWQ